MDTQNPKTRQSRPTRNQYFSNFQFGQDSQTHFVDNHEYHFHGEKLSPEEHRESQELAIMSSLEFSETDQRYASVDDNLNDTCAWIFCDQVVDRDAHSQVRTTINNALPGWLKSEAGGFLISGKAGSGKSTLMKYLTRNEKTKAMLQSWADVRSCSLMVASFFLWCSSSKLQSCQEGLWRSILHQTLKQDQALRTDVLAMRHEDKHVSNEYLKEQPWTRNELSSTLRELVTQVSRHKICVCIFIDGLDEYTEQEDILINDIELLLSSPFIKVCASSRPRVLYEASFREQLVLHEYTRSDVNQLINTSLCRNPKFVQLHGPAAAKEALVCVMRSRAQGVFLWVVLTTRELQKELAQNASLEELEDTLESLPLDLSGSHGLFANIIARSNPTYKLYLARLMLLLPMTVDFQLCEAYFVYEDKKHPNFATQDCLQLPERFRESWDHNSNPDSESSEEEVESNGTCCQYLFRECLVHHAGQSHPSGHHCRVRVVEMEDDAEAKSLKWCSDLVEVKRSRFACAVIQLMHRSLADYLALPEARHQLVLLAGPSFNPTRARLRLLLARSRLGGWEMAFAVGHFLRLAAKTMRSGAVGVVDLVEKFERVHSLNWHGKGPCDAEGKPRPYWAKRILHERLDAEWQLCDPIAMDHKTSQHAWFLALAVRENMIQFVEYSWKALAPGQRQWTGTVILTGLLFPVGDLRGENMSFLRLLFDSGVSPNVEYEWARHSADAREKLTLWQVFFRAVASAWGLRIAPSMETVLEFVDTFLHAGRADTTCSLPEGSQAFLGAMTGSVR